MLFSIAVGSGREGEALDGGIDKSVVPIVAPINRLLPQQHNLGPHELSNDIDSNSTSPSFDSSRTRDESWERRPCLTLQFKIFVVGFGNGARLEEKRVLGHKVEIDDGRRIIVHLTD